MEWYESEVQHLERTPVSPQGATLFYGSSTIRLWPSLQGDFPDCPVLNRGFGGATLAACVVFFERLVLPPHPGAFVLYAGDNDAGDGATAETIFQSFLQLQEKFRKHLAGIPFTFVSIKPSPARWQMVETIRTVNDRIRRQPVNFVDIFPHMLTPDGYPNARLFLEDGLHMSPAGYRIWKNVLTANRNTIFAGCSSEIVPSG